MLRETIFRFYYIKIIEKQEAVLLNEYKNNFIKNKTISMPDQFYIDLLEIFANDLNKKGVKLLMISVNERIKGEKVSQLDGFPFIKKKVIELNEKGILDYIDINEWFKSDEDFEISPVGHYDKRWNLILGSNLSKLIREKYSNL